MNGSYILINKQWHGQFSPIKRVDVITYYLWLWILGRAYWFEKDGTIINTKYSTSIANLVRETIWTSCELRTSIKILRNLDFIKTTAIHNGFEIQVNTQKAFPS